MPDNVGDANVLCIIEFKIINDGKIEDIEVTSNCDYCNAAVKVAVESSAQYWKRVPFHPQKRITVRFKYKYMIR